MAVIFMITSLSYTYVTSSRPSSESTILNVKIEEPASPAPAAPVTPAPKPDQNGRQAAPRAAAACGGSAERPGAG